MKDRFDEVVGRFFCDGDNPEPGKIPLVPGRVVIPYSLERLEKLNREHACSPMVFEGGYYTETGSKTTGVVLRIQEGKISPLGNETTPETAVGMVHNYVIVLVRNPTTGLWETKIEFLRMNLVEVRSKHSHIVLTKIDPERRGDFLYLSSGECLFDGSTLFVNIQSGMNWELNLSRPGISQVVGEVRVRMMEEGGKLETLLSRGVGPKNDFWGAISTIFFKQVLGYPVVEYVTSTLRKKTTESKSVIQSQWCRGGVEVEQFASLEDCKKRRGGVDLCKGGPEPTPEPAPSTPDLTKLTVPRLREMLESLGVEIVGRPRKAELISMLGEFLP